VRFCAIEMIVEREREWHLLEHGHRLRSPPECGRGTRLVVSFDAQRNNSRMGSLMELYINSGPNGVGKTTFARTFLPKYSGWVRRMTNRPSVFIGPSTCLLARSDGGMFAVSGSCVLQKELR